ncbi:MAG: hydrogenase maturation nickel metallochaperone HypA [Proteobacteria bacterium]|nr:hydrogenase maturation nickel metallochaperone HypA [Pseudomonadota bacterium]MBU4011138.1 hydrogenase maturation nickel metallochaperone HypA [Pseudomonadota bacterium]MBU4036760.1 hydrogenase maturation nickel metallochaperone HypA [Pseudomonadota bacterium]
MHEMGIALNILDIVKQEMDSYGAEKLISICLVVGEFTAIAHHSLTFCLEIITKDTPFEGVRLEIEQIPLIGRCINCKNEFAIEGNRFICTKCSSKAIETISGRELFIKEIEID